MVRTLEITCPPIYDYTPELDFNVSQPSGTSGGGTPMEYHLYGDPCNGTPFSYNTFAVTEGSPSTLHPGLAVITGHLDPFSFETTVILLPAQAPAP